MIVADHKPLNSLAVFAEVALDPPHVSKNLTNHLIGRNVPFLSSMITKEFDFGSNARNVNWAYVGSILLAFGFFYVPVYFELSLENCLEVADDEVLKVSSPEQRHFGLRSLQ